jgi:protein dithiol oxidoreductase (disulfide-forming)
MSSRTRVLAVMLVFCTLGAAAPPSPAPEVADFRTVVPAQPTSSPGKIEVIEFFSYGCPHCSDFYPLISAWAAKLPKDVVLHRVPVSFNRPAWISLARAYYALEASGDLERLDGALFHAIHQEHQQLFDEPSLTEWVGRNQGNAEKFAAAYVDFSVNTRTVQADQMAINFQVEAIPTLAVDGTYVAGADSSQGEKKYFDDLLTHTDGLITRVRAEHAAKAQTKAPPKAK